MLAHDSPHLMQGEDLCRGAVAHGLMGARCGCGHGGLWCHPCSRSASPPGSLPPAFGAFGGAQGSRIMERGSEVQPRGCWAGRWLRAEMLLSGFLSEQEM